MQNLFKNNERNGDLILEFINSLIADKEKEVLEYYLPLMWNSPKELQYIQDRLTSLKDSKE